MYCLQIHPHVYGYPGLRFEFFPQIFKSWVSKKMSGEVSSPEKGNDYEIH